MIATRCVAVFSHRANMMSVTPTNFAEQYVTCTVSSFDAFFNAVGIAQVSDEGVSEGVIEPVCDCVCTYGALPSP